MMKTDRQMEKEHEALTEGSLLGMVRDRYPASEYVVLDQVRSSNTVRARIADAVAVGLWKNRDLTIQGFEFKVVRNSWLQELKDPAKAEEVIQYCDRWWLVAADESIVKADELPKPWGLYLPDGKGHLRIAVEAPSLQPKPLDRAFLGCLMKRVLDQRLCEIKEGDLQGEYNRGRQEGISEGQKRSDSGNASQIDWLQKQLFDAKKKIALIDDRLGGSFGLDDHQIAAWFGIIKEVVGRYRGSRNPENVIKLFNALKVVSDAPLEDLKTQFCKLKVQADEIASFINRQMEKIDLLNEIAPDQEAPPSASTSE